MSDIEFFNGFHIQQCNDGSWMLTASSCGRDKFIRFSSREEAIAEGKLSVFNPEGFASRWRLRELRASLDLTQASLSSSTGIPLRTIEDWEAGRRTPPYWLLPMLEHALRAGYKAH